MYSVYINGKHSIVSFYINQHVRLQEKLRGGGLVIQCQPCMPYFILISNTLVKHTNPSQLLVLHIYTVPNQEQNPNIYAEMEKKSGPSFLKASSSHF